MKITGKNLAAEWFNMMWAVLKLKTAAHLIYKALFFMLA
jgi:hypothetical protein